MAKFLFVYHNNSDAPAADGPPDPDLMAAWGAWFGELGASVIDGGNPSGETATVASDGSSSPGGGANPVTGYSLIDADDLQDAIAKARGCPVLKGGGSVEVCATVDI